MIITSKLSSNTVADNVQQDIVEMGGISTVSRSPSRPEQLAVGIFTDFMQEYIISKGDHLIIY